MGADDQHALTERELLIRIDTKLEGVIEDKKDHEARIRKLEDARGLMDEKISRAVTPRQLWAGLASVVAAVSAAFPLINSIMGPGR